MTHKGKQGEAVYAMGLERLLFSPFLYYLLFLASPSKRWLFIVDLLAGRLNTEQDKLH